MPSKLNCSCCIIHNSPRAFEIFLEDSLNLSFFFFKCVSLFSILYSQTVAEQHKNFRCTKPSIPKNSIHVLLLPKNSKDVNLIKGNACSIFTSSSNFHDSMTVSLMHYYTEKKYIKNGKNKQMLLVQNCNTQIRMVGGNAAMLRKCRVLCKRQRMQV